MKAKETKKEGLTDIMDKFKLAPTKLVKFSDGKIIPMNRQLRRLNKIK